MAKSKKKLPGCFGGIKKVSNAITEPVANDDKKTDSPEHKPPGVSREIIQWKGFRHNQQNDLCEWVNTNYIKVQTIVADGNKLYVFYWKRVLND